VNPPRAIWTHPYDDEQYLREHPEVREKVESRDMRQQQDSQYPPPSMAPGRRHSFNGHDSAITVPENDEATRDISTRGMGKGGGLLGMLMGKVAGATEGRESRSDRREDARVNIQQCFSVNLFFFLNRFLHSLRWGGTDGTQEWSGNECTLKWRGNECTTRWRGSECTQV
jgi:hypothetical protein